MAMATAKWATKVREVTSDPVPVPETDSWGDHSTYTPGACPTSDHRRKVHRARATTRRTVTTTWGDGRTSKSYTDHCVCRFCGYTWNQEWMPGAF